MIVTLLFDSLQQLQHSIFFFFFLIFLLCLQCIDNTRLHWIFCDHKYYVECIIHLWNVLCFCFRFKDHPILNERYLLLNLLGKGGFSEVHKVGHDWTLVLFCIFIYKLVLFRLFIAPFFLNAQPVHFSGFWPQGTEICGVQDTPVKSRVEGWQESQLYQVSKLHGCPGVLMQVQWEILQSWNHISVGLIRYSLKKRVSVQSVNNGSCFYCEKKMQF